jgi:antitoxin component YwqK of YwqJK toxin-antitoxin module
MSKIMQGINNFLSCSLLLTCLLSCFHANPPVKKAEIQLQKFPDGSTKPLGLLVNQKKEGLWIEYDSLGRIEYVAIFNKGIKNGQRISFFESGSILDIGFINDEIQYGEWKQYNDDGQLHSKGSYENDERSGIWEYYTNGQLNKKILYQKDTSILLMDNHLENPKATHPTWVW